MSAVAVLMTEAELEAKIDARVAAAVAKLAPAQPAELLTMAQVCDMLQLSRRVVARYMQAEGLPHQPVCEGSRVSRFKRSEVLAWWDSRQKGKR